MTRNDVLVLGSDGIFDNLFDGQIVAVVTAVQKAGGGPEVVITIVLFQLPVFSVMIHFSDYQCQVIRLSIALAFLSKVTINFRKTCVESNQELYSFVVG